jgi:VanZ family protein
MWGPAAVWAAVLFLLSAWPNPVGPAWLRVSDKVAHLALFGVLGVALGIGRRWSGLRVPHWVVIFVGMLYGVTDEWHQSMVPRRVPSIEDWYADVTGVVLGYVLVTLFFSRARRVAGAEQRTD